MRAIFGQVLIYTLYVSFVYDFFISISPDHIYMNNRIIYNIALNTSFPQASLNTVL